MVSVVTGGQDFFRRTSVLSTRMRTGVLFSSFGLALCLSACGNGWMSSGERVSSPSAQMLKAQHLYDKGKFEGAIKIYKEILEKDPNNENARIRLAYSYNGLAGLSPFDLILKLSDTATVATPKPSGAATSSSAASSNGMSTLIKIAGLTSAQQRAATKVNPTKYADLLNAATKYKSLASSDPATYAGLVSLSQKLQSLQTSWTTVCRLIPARILKAVVGTNSVRKTNLDIEKCLGGEASSTQSPAILFAAAMEAMAQGVALYQIKVDQNGDGTVDAVKIAETLSSDIQALNTQAATATTAETITSSLNTLNTKMAELQKIGETMTGEIVDLAFAHFEIMAVVVTAIKGVMPENVAASLLKGVDKFEQNKGKVADYAKTGADKGKVTTSSKQTKISASITNSKDTVDKYVVNFQKSNPSSEEQAKFNSTFTQTCSQFDSVKGTYGLPDSTQKPANCSASLAAETVRLVEDVEVRQPLVGGRNESFTLTPSGGLFSEAANWNTEAQSIDEEREVMESILDFSRLGDVWLSEID